MLAAVHAASEAWAAVAARVAAGAEVWDERLGEAARGALLEAADALEGCAADGRMAAVRARLHGP